MPKADLVWCIKGPVGVLGGKASRSRAFLENRRGRDPPSALEMWRLETGESPILKTFLSLSLFFLKCGHEKKWENNHALLYAADTPTPPHMTKHHIYRRSEVHVNPKKYYCREDSVLWDLENWRWSRKAMFLLCVHVCLCVCAVSL